MREDQIQILTGEPSGGYEPVGHVKARKGAQPTPFNKRPSEDDLNVKLRSKAAKLGADAIIHVSYRKGVIPSSWRGMTAQGLAVRLS